MAIEPPQQFTGIGSGTAWWKAFTKWAATAVPDDKNKVTAFPAFLEDAAEAWWEGLKTAGENGTDIQPKKLEELRVAFVKQYPAPAADEGLFPDDEDHHQLFLRHLSRKMDDKSLLDVVETSFRDKYNVERKQQVLYCQDWVKTAYDLSELVPGIQDNIKGSMLRDALPKAIRKYIAPSSSTIYAVAKDVMRMDTDALTQDIESARNLQLVLNRQPLRTNQTTPMVAPLPYQPFQSMSGGNQGQPQSNMQQPRPQPTGYQYVPYGGGSNVQPGGRPAPPGVNAPAVRQDHHLTYPDTPNGRAAYQHEMSRYQSRYGENPPVNSSIPYPLTPGTLAPGHNVCDSCGREGHIRADCRGPYLPDREIRFRSLNSKHQRDENRVGREVNAIEMYGGYGGYGGYANDGYDDSASESGKVAGQL